MISPATIEEIKQKMDIVEVVGDFVTLKRAGSSYRALSPFTNERTPSFYVVPSKGIFKDFSSGKGGDSITFIMEVDGLSYLEALKYLAKKYNIEIVEEGRSEEFDAQQSKRESLFIVMNYAKEQFQKTLLEHEEGKAIGLSYFKERGFTEESIKTFELGFTLDKWDHLLQSAKADGYQQEILEQAGLVINKEGKVYDRFRSRVMFPVHNVTGKVVAFGARILNTDSGSSKKQPKYLNSPETDLYNKSKVLYGIYQAKQAIRQADNCFIVEGYTDVISMHQTGIANVVSSSGTALTEDQIKLLSRYTKNVTVLFDGDKAGIKASIRGIDMLLEGGLNVKAVALPEGEDPDSQAKALGTTAFQHFIEKESQDIIRFKTKLFLNEAKDDPVKKAEVIKDIIRTISKIDDPVKRTVYLKECSDLLGIQESVLIAEQNKLLIQKNRERGQQDSSAFFQDTPPPPEEEIVENIDVIKLIELQEKESIRVLVNYGKLQIKSGDNEEENLLSYFLTEIEEINFTTPIYREILETIKEKLQQGEIIDGEYLLQNGTEEIKRVVVDLMTSKYEISESWSKKFQIHVPTEIDLLKDVTYSNILRLKFRIIQHLIDEENKKIKEAISEDALDEILDEINELKHIEMDIAKILGNVTTK
ncbi:MAG: DNA primase [Cyclobacteriaceae bacterium]|jgi:DNA primase